MRIFVLYFVICLLYNLRIYVNLAILTFKNLVIFGDVGASTEAWVRVFDNPMIVNRSVSVALNKLV